MKRALLYIVLFSLIITPILYGVGVLNVHAQNQAGAIDPKVTTSHAVSCSITNFFSGGGFGMCFATIVHYGLFTPVAWVFGGVGYLFNYVVQELVFRMGAMTGMLEAVTIAWTVMRDIANVFLVFLILFIGIATIIRAANYNSKQLLYRVVIAALLVNFSLYIAKVVIDVSNIFAAQTYIMILKEGMTDPLTGKTAMPNAAECADSNQVTPVNYDSKCFTIGISGAIENVLKINTVYDSAQADNAVQADHIGWNILYMSLMGTVLLLVLIFIFLAAIVLFVTRFVTLVMLMIVSPIAFVSLITGRFGYGKTWFNMLINNALFAPVYFLLLWVALLVISRMMNVYLPGGGTYSSLALANTSGFTLLIVFVVGAGLLIGALVAAKRLGVAGSGAVMKTGERMLQGAGRFAGGATFGAGAWAMQNTIGRRAANTAANEELLKMSGQPGWKGFSARAELNMNRLLARQTYDARGVLGAEGQKRLGKPSKGGYATKLSKQAEGYAKFGQSLGKENAKVYAETLGKQRRFFGLAPGVPLKRRQGAQRITKGGTSKATQDKLKKAEALRAAGDEDGAAVLQAEAIAEIASQNAPVRAPNPQGGGTTPQAQTPPQSQYDRDRGVVLAAAGGAAQPTANPMMRSEMNRVMGTPESRTANTASANLRGRGGGAPLRQVGPGVLPINPTPESGREDNVAAQKIREEVENQREYTSAADAVRAVAQTPPTTKPSRPFREFKVGDAAPQNPTPQGRTYNTGSGSPVEVKNAYGNFLRDDAQGRRAPQQTTSQNTVITPTQPLPAERRGRDSAQGTIPERGSVFNNSAPGERTSNTVTPARSAAPLRNISTPRSDTPSDELTATQEAPSAPITEPTPLRPAPNPVTPPMPTEMRPDMWEADRANQPVAPQPQGEQVATPEPATLPIEQPQWAQQPVERLQPVEQPAAVQEQLLQRTAAPTPQQPSSPETSRSTTPPLTSPRPVRRFQPVTVSTSAPEDSWEARQERDSTQVAQTLERNQIRKDAEAREAQQRERFLNAEAERERKAAGTLIAAQAEHKAEQMEKIGITDGASYDRLVKSLGRDTQFTMTDSAGGRNEAYHYQELNRRAQGLDMIAKLEEQLKTSPNPDERARLAGEITQVRSQYNQGNYTDWTQS